MMSSQRGTADIAGGAPAGAAADEAEPRHGRDRRRRERGRRS